MLANPFLDINLALYCRCRTTGVREGVAFSIRENVRFKIVNVPVAMSDQPKF